MDLGLKGLRALVTGGTRGIGRAVVETLAAEGAAVAFCARTPEDVKETVTTLTGNGGSVSGHVADVGDEVGLRKWVADAAGTVGGVDIVVANVSALAIPDSPENWQHSFDVDMMGTVRLVQAAMPYLERSQAPSIVTISSVSGREIDFAAGPYGTFKAAIIHYTQGLAYQLAGKGIRANSVSPGNTFFAGGVWDTMQRESPEFFGQALALNPTGRMAKPEEIARGVAFLASPAASFITGTNLLIDGALTRGVQFLSARNPLAKPPVLGDMQRNSCVPLAICAILGSSLGVTACQSNGSAAGGSSATPAGVAAAGQASSPSIPAARATSATPVATAASSSAPGSHASPPVSPAAHAPASLTRVVADCSQAPDTLQVEPRDIVIACADGGLGVAKLTWTQWGITTATGQGRLYENLCEPNCAEGKFATYPVRVTLSRVKSSSRGAYFGELSVRWEGHRPPNSTPDRFPLMPPAT